MESKEIDLRIEHDWERYYSLKLGDIFVEAGAYIGLYGVIASLKVGENGRVILIEPAPNNFTLLQKTVKEQNLSNVTLVNKAVWSKKGKMPFLVKGPSLAYHVLGAYRSENISKPTEDAIEVEVDTVDNILAELNISKVDLFASDVEGSERRMIKGMDKVLSEKRVLNLAVTVYHKPNDPKTIRRMLEAKGYQKIVYDNPKSGGIIYASCGDKYGGL